MSIFIDSGTTTLHIADYLPNDRFLITTSSPDLARELHRTPLAVINIVGGMYNRENHTLSGQGAIKFISDMTFDLCYHGAVRLYERGRLFIRQLQRV